MRKIIVSEYLSLDGVMEAPENWVFPFETAEMAELGKSQILALDALLLGRVTYEIFASYWPTHLGQDMHIADKFNNQPKYVVSSSIKKAEWNHTTVIRANAADEIRQLKQQPGGDIGITGSATLVQSLMRACLIDEFRLLVYPIVLGGGKQLFAHGIGPDTLKLVDCRTFQSGVVFLTYQPERKE